MRRTSSSSSTEETTTTNNPHLSGEENIHEFVQDEQMPLNNTDTEIEDFMSSLSLNQTITKRSSLTTMQDQEDQITSPSPQFKTQTTTQVKTQTTTQIKTQTTTQVKTQVKTQTTQMKNRPNNLKI